jgi:predicted nucleic acid-binding Zn finger protein
MPYQIALERNEAGNLRIHCTCADAVFRAEEEGRFCKHVHGLLQVGRADQAEGDALPLGA